MRKYVKPRAKFHELKGARLLLETSTTQTEDYGFSSHSNTEEDFD